MTKREIYRRLWEIKEAHKGGYFDYNTMFKVSRDATEALKIVSAYNETHKSIAHFTAAIALANSATKEEDTTKKEAIGALEHGIDIFCSTGHYNI